MTRKLRVVQYHVIRRIGYACAMTDSGIGLRERKKAMTRAALAAAALRIVHDKGLENATIEEIAAEAVVSPRTFSNYFSCKEEAIVAAGEVDTAPLMRQVARRPRGEALMHALAELVPDYIRAMTDEQRTMARIKVELAQRYPTIAPWQSAWFDTVEADLRDVVSRRTRMRPEADLYPTLVAGVAISALRSSIRVWAVTGAEADRLPQIVADAYGQLVAGLPAPARLRKTRSGQVRATEPVDPASAHPDPSDSARPEGISA